MARQQQFNLFIQQPTVPHYRVPFFDALSHHHPGLLTVYGSQTTGDGPSSANVARDYLHLDYRCSQWLGGRAYWQQGLSLDDGARPGDVIVLSGNPRFLSTFRLALAARRKKMGLVWWGHGWSPTSRKWAIAARKGLMSHMDAVLLYSDAEVAEWRPRLSAEIGIFGAQNTIDQSDSNAERIKWNEESLSEFQLRHGMQGRKILLFCGRLRTNPRTGIDLLIKALPQLIQADPTYLLVVIGDGADKQQLKTLADSLNVANHIMWLGAQYKEADIAPWFLSSMCFVYPGPIGLSILHAMGYGLPVLTHDNRQRHNPEIVVLKPESNGLVFRDGEIKHLAEQIRRVTTDTMLRLRLSSNALNTAHDEYTLSRMVERFQSAVTFSRNRALERLAG